MQELGEPCPYEGRATTTHKCPFASVSITFAAQRRAAQLPSPEVGLGAYPVRRSVEAMLHAASVLRPVDSVHLALH